MPTRGVRASVPSSPPHTISPGTVRSGTSPEAGAGIGGRACFSSRRKTRRRLRSSVPRVGCPVSSRRPAPITLRSVVRAWWGPPLDSICTGIVTSTLACSRRSGSKALPGSRRPGWSSPGPDGSVLGALASSRRREVVWGLRRPVTFTDVDRSRNPSRSEARRAAFVSSSGSNSTAKPDPRRSGEPTAGPVSARMRCIFPRISSRPTSVRRPNWIAWSSATGTGRSRTT